MSDTDKESEECFAFMIRKERQKKGQRQNVKKGKQPTREKNENLVLIFRGNPDRLFYIYIYINTAGNSYEITFFSQYKYALNLSEYVIYL